MPLAPPCGVRRLDLTGQTQPNHPVGHPHPARAHALADLSRKRDHCKTSSPSRLAALAPLDEEVLGDLRVLVLRCEGEARASKGRTRGRSG
jgi:hypothetical protein